MSENLVIVESPAKAKTIKKYLGKGFEVLASYGHVRDLVPKEGAVDPEHDFTMKYQLIERNEKHVDAIAKALKKADALYLATDPDREGEAISWHLTRSSRRRARSRTRTCTAWCSTRSPSAPSTKRWPTRAPCPRNWCTPSRRAAPWITWWVSTSRRCYGRRSAAACPPAACSRRRCASSASARTRSRSSRARNTGPSLRQRREGRPAFQPAPVPVRRATKVEQFSFRDEKSTRAAEAGPAQIRRRQAQGRLRWRRSSAGATRPRPSPPPPCSRKPRASSASAPSAPCAPPSSCTKASTSRGEGPVGLISYMRTDSVNLAAEAMAEIREVIAKRFGADHLPPEPRVYKTKSKNAQEAHEAIRPTSAARAPEEIQGKLTEEQRKLYELIWKRTIACQMEQAVFDTVSCRPGCRRQQHFPRHGSVLVVPGFMAVYQEGHDDDGRREDEEERMLPPLEEGETVTLEGHPVRPAFHRAAAALLGSEPGEGSGGVRHRPALHLRHHHLDAASSASTWRWTASASSPRTWAAWWRSSSPSISPSTWTMTSPPSWRTSWTRCPAARRNGCR